MIGNLLKCTSAKNCHNRWSFYKAIAKIKRCNFFASHGTFILYAVITGLHSVSFVPMSPFGLQLICFFIILSSVFAANFLMNPVHAVSILCSPFPRSNILLHIGKLVRWKLCINEMYSQYLLCCMSFCHDPYRQPEYCGWAFSLSDDKALREKWKLIPAGIDVLMTHGPPAGQLYTLLILTTKHDILFLKLLLSFAVMYTIAFCVIIFVNKRSHWTLLMLCRPFAVIYACLCSRLFRPHP